MVSRRGAAVALVLALIGMGAGVPAGPAQAAPAEDFCTAPQRIADTSPVPWAQSMLGPDRSWAFTKGGGVVVAVLDSGVDPNHPQLKKHVLPGFDAVTGHGTGNSDCVGTGTNVAGIIVAQSRTGVGFHGIAPSAKVYPIRITTDQQGTAPVTGTVMARGINQAVAAGAKVIDISMGMAATSQPVKDAIAAAQDRDVLVIAAIGDKDGSGSTSNTPYPGGYKGVLAVGAIDATGTVWTDSRSSSSVALVGPGVHVAVPERISGIGVADGTRLAAAFVAGTAALVRSRYPGMSATDVTRRLEATAIPAPGGNDTRSYGQGIVNPYGAVTEEITDSVPGDLAGLVPSAVDSAAAARAAAWSHSSRLAWLITGVALGLVGLTLAAAVAIPLGRRRRWRAALAAAPTHHQEDEEPAPPLLLFQDQDR